MRKKSNRYQDHPGLVDFTIKVRPRIKGEIEHYASLVDQDPVDAASLFVASYIQLERERIERAIIAGDLPLPKCHEA